MHSECPCRRETLASGFRTPSVSKVWDQRKGQRWDVYLDQELSPRINKSLRTDESPRKRDFRIRKKKKRKTKHGDLRSSINYPGQKRMNV